MYIYKPKQFYITVFVATWTFWLFGILVNESLSRTFAMLLGLISPATIAIIMVFTSKSDALKKDFKRKLFHFWKVNPRSLVFAAVLFSAIIACSILLSTLFGQSLNQFSFTKDFSFTGVGLASAFATICFAAILEEVGWRGYGEDAIAQYHSWFTESIIFGFVWAAWHIPLFWVPGTYHYEIRQMSFLYMINFLVSVVPFGFITTWVYVKNGRSMLASILFHLFVNFCQEKIAMTQTTKCVESLVVFVAATLIVLANRDMFFETRHVGHILE